MVGLEPGAGTTLPSAVPLIPSANQDDERIWCESSLNFVDQFIFQDENPPGSQLEILEHGPVRGHRFGYENLTTPRYNFAKSLKFSEISQLTLFLLFQLEEKRW